MSYRVGDWFAVPLRETGFGVGLVARAQDDGVLLGYFFGPKRDDMPQLADVDSLTPNDAVTVRRFGHLALKRGSWPNLGQVADWNPETWPIPVFGRYEELTGRAFRVTYDANDPNRLMREDATSKEEADQLPKDGLLGAGAAEIVLTKLLG